MFYILFKVHQKKSWFFMIIIILLKADKKKKKEKLRCMKTWLVLTKMLPKIPKFLQQT